MNHRITTLSLAALGLGLSGPALATNGTNLIGIGPISRALGGTGIAAPQDAISAVFSNPAAMCISPSCATPQADFALTAFMPEVNASLTMGPALGGFTVKGASEDKIYPIPAMGFSLPLGGEASRWRAGFAAYGVSGLGVDYEGTALSPLVAPAGPVFTDYTDLQILKIAPSIAYSVNPDVSIGASLHVDYATLDLDAGKEHDFGLGVQLGATWKPIQNVTIGATYTTSQANTFDNIHPFVGDLELEAPQQAGLGVAWTGMDDRLLIEIDGKWINWSDASGYGDFEWDDQWTIGIGVQYEAIPSQLFLRAGYNYGKNPVSQNNFDATNNQNFAFETLRTIGFPAIVEHHLGLGFGYHLKDNLVLNLAYVHAFEEKFTESDPATGTSVSSTLGEDSVDLGLTWRF